MAAREGLHAAREVLDDAIDLARGARLGLDEGLPFGERLAVIDVQLERRLGAARPHDDSRVSLELVDEHVAGRQFSRARPVISRRPHGALPQLRGWRLPQLLHSDA